MPITLLPTPQRVQITRENFALGQPATCALLPGAAPEVADALRHELEELFAVLEAAGGAKVPNATLRFTLFEHTVGGLPEEVPEGARGEAFRLQVSPAGIEVEAGAPAGWIRAARLLRGLREKDELVGIRLLDWPVFSIRQVDLPWPATALDPAALTRLLSLLALGRYNRVGVPPDPDGQAVPREFHRLAARLGLEWTEPAERASFRLIERSCLFPPYSTTLPKLQEVALTAAEVGESAFIVSLGAVDGQTSLEALAYGAIFAGDCAWNPRKADLKLFRRWYSLRWFGFDSRGPLQAIDGLETGASEWEPAPGAVVADPETTLAAALELQDPFETPLFAGLLRPEERADGLERQANAALAALAPLKPDTEERAVALQGLQWMAQRLKMLGRRYRTAARVRELYRSAYIATASPRAVSERLLRAAELLETEAAALDEHRVEWHALWRRERQGPHDPVIEAAYRARVAGFRERARRLRQLRNRYVQTGSLPSPAEEGMEQAGTRLAAGLQPQRLPPQQSPAWWPEGGAARLRVEVDCPEAAAGIPWEVQVDFRALAGEAGAFNIRSARLLTLTETDEAGQEHPCQLVRGGFVFIAEPGKHDYFLYLDPNPGPDLGFRETRASQSRAGVRLENRLMRLRLSVSQGFISAWRLLDPQMELMPPEEELEEDAEPRRSEWRLRVLETGPLLARAHAEHQDGRIRQLDLFAGQPWAELSVNAAWSEFLLPDRPELWPEGAEALFGEEERTARFPLTDTAAEASDVHWAAQHRPDGLTVALATPEAAAHATVGRDGLRLWGPPQSGRILLSAGQETDPVDALSRLLAAQRQPPRVRLGVVEERRVREF